MPLLRPHFISSISFPRPYRVLSLITPFISTSCTDYPNLSSRPCDLTRLRDPRHILTPLSIAIYTSMLALVQKCFASSVIHKLVLSAFSRFHVPEAFFALLVRDVVVRLSLSTSLRVQPHGSLEKQVRTRLDYPSFSARAHPTLGEYTQLCPRIFGDWTRQRTEQVREEGAR